VQCGPQNAAAITQTNTVDLPLATEIDYFMWLVISFLWIYTGSCLVPDMSTTVHSWRLLTFTWYTNRFNIQELYFLSTLFVCFVFVWEQTAICATYSINWLVFITEMKSVYCTVQTGSLNKAVCGSSLNG
jgi:hypothetical protein